MQSRSRFIILTAVVIIQFLVYFSVTNQNQNVVSGPPSQCKQDKLVGKEITTLREEIVRQQQEIAQLTKPQRPTTNPEHENVWFRIDETLLQCDQKRITKFMEANPAYSEGDSTRSKQFYDIARQAVDVLEQLDLPYFIAFGTLLGWYRECNFIKHTSDIDFGLPVEDLYSRQADITEAFEEVGIKLVKTWGTKDLGFELKFMHEASKTKIDLFSFYHEWTIKDHRHFEQFYTSIWHGDFCRKLAFPLTEFVRVNLSGIITTAPKNTEDWLVSVYGSDWNSPNSKYHWWDSPKFSDEINIHKNVDLHEELRFKNNLLINPSFEENVDITDKRFGWNVTNCKNCSIYKLDAKQGDSSYIMNNQEQSISQTIKINETSSILVSAWSKALTPTNQTIYNSIGYYMEVIGRKKNGKLAPRKKVWYDYKISTWQYKSLIYQPPQAVIDVTVKFIFNITGSILVDNFSVRTPADCDKCVNGDCVYGECNCFKGWSGTQCDLINEI